MAHKAVSAIQTTSKELTSNYAFVSKDEIREFMALFPDIVKELTDVDYQSEMPEVYKHWAKVLYYNVPNGKQIRGLAVVAAYKIIEKFENLTTENIRLANILGWCVELIHAFLLTSGDVVNQSEMRRGVSCWYLNEDVGLKALNDSQLLYHSLFTLLKSHFSKHQCYLPCMELFQYVTMKTIIGQTLDGLYERSNSEPIMDAFTMSKYDGLVQYKTTYYTFQLPMTAAMYMANLYDEEMHRQTTSILMEIGLFFQIQTDFLDCFGDPQKTGKKCNDIREGKCTWLAVVALQRANSAQCKVMEDHYGKNNPVSVGLIKSLYEELSLPSAYTQYEEESFNIINLHIQQISKGLPHELFFKLMGTLYKREC